MPLTNSAILSRLQKEIMPLQGYKPLHQKRPGINLGPINQSFPEHNFPLGAIHEFLTPLQENFPATGGFIAGILGSLMKYEGLTIWINSTRTIFPPSLKYFGVEPDRIIFINLKKTKDILWTLEEALTHKGLAAVVAEIQDLDLTSSRRLQLAVEHSRVTGFILRNKPVSNTTTSLSRWKIKSLRSELPDNMPGIGFPRWNVELMKIRNGKPGNWQIEWVAGKFREVNNLELNQPQLHKKTG